MLRGRCCFPVCFRISLAIPLLLLLASRLPAQGWERLGPEGGLVVSTGKDAQGQVYLGMADGHVFASADRGVHWELRGRVGGRMDGVVARLMGDPHTPGRIYAGVWFREAGAGGGVFRSDDGGRSWVASGLAGEAVRALEFAPSNPATLVAGTRSGVFRSRDAGATWERISPPGDIELLNVDSIAIDPGDPQSIYAGTYHLPWKTTDGGKTWESIATGLIDDSDVMSMRIDAENAARMYLSACSGIYRSEDRGALWVKLQGIPYGARRTQAIVQDPGDSKTLYAATTEGLWVTRDAGESWERTTPGEWVVNAVEILPGSGAAAARLLLGTEAEGVLESDDSGRTFRPANTGFTHQSVKQLVAEEANPRHLLMLLERRGLELLESRDAGQNWTPLPVGASSGKGKITFSVDRIDRVYGSPWGWIAEAAGELWLWDSHGPMWRAWKPMVFEPASPSARNRRTARKKPLVAPEIAGFGGGSAFVFAQGSLYVCPISGDCNRLSGFGRLRAAKAAVSGDGRTLWVVSGGKLAVSRDSGKTAAWSDLPVKEDEAPWVQSDVTGMSRLFVGTKRGLYLSSDQGAHWTRAENGLPAAAVGRLLRGNQGYLITLQQGGLYGSRDAGSDWMRLDRDAERGRFTGMVETGAADWLLGSETEGVLRWRGSTTP